MKTALVLLCLAAGQAAANIFRTHRRQNDWIVQPYDYYKNMPESSRSSEERGWDVYSAVIADVDSLRNNLILQGVPAIYRDSSEHIFDEAFETMRHIDEDTKRRIHHVFGSGWTEEAELNATQLLKKNGYRVEEHVAITADGYYLTLIRIRGKTGEEIKEHRPAVLLVHGLLGSADDWLLLGPGESLAYQMVDAGLDVWLGNVRGSRYSRRHAAKHPAQPDFWQFAVDEIAAHDLPAMIDHVLRETQQSQLYYVGHSAGTTAFFAMASAYPEHGRKVAMMHALAPTVYMRHARSPLLRMISPASRSYEWVTRELGPGEFRPSARLVRSVGGRMCEEAVGCEHVCGNINFVIAGVDTTGLVIEKLPVIARHLPAGGSTRHIKQFGQAVAADELRKYDYGSEVNMKVYGQPEPPKYNMTDVQVPVAIYYSEEDWLAHPADVERLHGELPDVRDFYKVPEQHFGHMDFQFSQKTSVINQRVVDTIVKDHMSSNKY
ncbi:lipase 3-like [Aricia agestis]|uniref:lipase 3-like n=1 Tax=Aricia agestis TaxID=91739 RepID=UPI001C20B471|nr:lipase 3-like [Aricia agestis]